MQSTRPELGIDGLKNMIVVVPSLREQQKISQHLDSRCIAIDELIETKSNQLAMMRTYKKSLIYEYVTGKKRVKEVQ